MSEGSGFSLLQKCARCTHAVALLGELGKLIGHGSLSLASSEGQESVGELRVNCPSCQNFRWIWTAEGAIVSNLLRLELKAAAETLVF